MITALVITLALVVLAGALQYAFLRAAQEELEETEVVLYLLHVDMKKAEIDPFEQLPPRARSRLFIACVRGSRALEARHLAKAAREVK